MKTKSNINILTEKVAPNGKTIQEMKAIVMASGQDQKHLSKKDFLASLKNRVTQ